MTIAYVTPEGRVGLHRQDHGVHTLLQFQDDSYAWLDRASLTPCAAPYWAKRRPSRVWGFVRWSGVALFALVVVSCVAGALRSPEETARIQQIRAERAEVSEAYRQARRTPAPPVEAEPPQRSARDEAWIRIYREVQATCRANGMTPGECGQVEARARRMWRDGVL